MTDTSPTDRIAVPWHLWVVGFVSLLWNGMGVADYTLTQIRFDPYLASFTEDQLAFFYGFPGWIVANWAVGVWSALAGSVLLLLRSKWTVWVWALSLAALLIGSVYWYGFTNAYEVTGPWAAIFNGVLVIVAALLFFYAQGLAKKGVLR